MRVKVFITHHEEKRAQSKAHELAKQREDLFIPKRTDSNKFFESATFKDANVDDPSIDFVGHVTHSYKNKIAPFDFESLCAKYDASADVIGLFPANTFSMYEFAEKVHPGFMAIWARLMELLGHKDFMALGQPTSFYSNYWIARRPLWNEYCSFASDAMHHMATDPELIRLCQADSGYKGTVEALPPSKLQEICGKPYYTFEPFIMERLPCFFFHLKQARVKVITSPTEEAWNTYTPFSGASFVVDTKKKRFL